MRKKNLISKSIGVILAAAMVVTSMTGCGGGNGNAGSSGSSGEAVSDGEVKKGGTLKFGLSTEPYTLDPMIGAGYGSKNVALAIYEGLFKFDDEGNVQNALCKDYSISKDGKTYTFTLTDANFQNGDPVTAEDVKYSFERIMNKDAGAYYYSMMTKNVDKIEAKDDKTCVVTLKAPFQAFINYLATKEMLIVSESWTEEHDGDISQEPMGAGPFKFVSWDSGVSIKLEANKDYYIPDQPYLDGIEFSFFADENARVNALETKSVDIIEYTPQSQFDTINGMKDLEVLEQPGPASYLIMNTKNKYLSDKKVRQAITYAINKQDVLNAAFSGKGTILNGSPLTEDSLGYTKEQAECYTQDVDKAKELLKEAGYPNGFKIKILTSSTYSFMEQTAVAVQSSLKEVGIDAEIESVEWSTFNQRSNAGECELATQAFLGDVMDPDWLNTMYAEGGGYNMAAYQSDKYDKLMKEGAAESDESKRQKIYEKVVDVIMDDCPYAFLCYRSQGTSINKKVKGFKMIGGNAWPCQGVTLAYTWLDE